MFTDHWWQVGILVRKPGLVDNPAYPDLVWAETGRSLGDPATEGAASALAPELALTLANQPEWGTDLRAYR